METVDEEITKEAIRFMKKAKKANKPFFLWWNATRMHIWTRLNKESEGKTGLGVYPDGMVEHDGQVGEMLERRSTISASPTTPSSCTRPTTAPRCSPGPTAAPTPFRGEKNTNWEGGYRVPCAIRWPGCNQAGHGATTTSSPTRTCCPPWRLRPATRTSRRSCSRATSVGGKTFKVHLDGYDIARSARQARRPARARSSSTSTTTARSSRFRYNQWKLVFAEQRAHGLDVWQDPFVQLRLPKLFNLRSDPFETADNEGMDYGRWRVEHAFLLVPAQQLVGQFLATFKAYPPRQKPGSFSIDSVLQQLSGGTAVTN